MGYTTITHKRCGKAKPETGRAPGLFCFETANFIADQDGVVSQAAKPSVRARGRLCPLSGQGPRYRAGQLDGVPGWELCPVTARLSLRLIRAT